MGKSKRAPREAPPPGKFCRSLSGTYFKLIQQRQRDSRGRKLYRLLSLADGVKCSQLWTIEQLSDARVRWLKRRPAARS